MRQDVGRVALSRGPLIYCVEETDNPGGLKWLNGVVGMPEDVQKVVDVLAQVRNSSPELIARSVYTNFLRLIENDPWLVDLRSSLTVDKGSVPG